MAKLTAEEFQEKHARRLKASIPDIQRGVDRVTENPMEKAAKKKDKMINNLTAAINDGKWERGLKRVSLEEWKKKTISKVNTRIATGIDEAADKVKAFASELLPYQDSLKTKVNALPDTTIEDSANRMLTWMRGMTGFKRSG